MLPEQPHRLGGVDRRAAADGDDEVGVEALEHLDAGSHLVLVGLGVDIGEDVDGVGVEVVADLVDRATRLGRRVGHDEHAAGGHGGEALERADVEVGVRRDAEPLRRRLAARRPS